MSTTFDPPICPNSTGDGIRCARSDVVIIKETDKEFVFRCRTCRTMNIWPKPPAEARGRYEAGLMAESRERQKQEALRRKRSYSFGSR